MKSRRLPKLKADLRQTLLMAARGARHAADRWWIIGSAALALHGAAVDEVGDVDVLMSASDARKILSGLGVKVVGGRQSELFRSAILGSWGEPPLPVEIMAEFHVAVGGVWTPIEPDTREQVPVDGETVFVPAREELVRLLRMFGRPKDLARVRLLL